MKALSLSILFAALPAWSCPQLSGSYKVCRSKNNILIESTDLTVKQSRGVDGHERFAISFLQDGTTERQSYELVANQVPVTESWVSDTGVQFVGITTTSCDGNVLYLESVITADGEHWKTEHNQIFRRGSAMIQTSEGRVVEMPFRDTLTCR